MNPIISGAAGLYIVLAILKGNGNKLLTNLSEEIAFIPWIVSALVLYWIWTKNIFDPLGRGFVTLAVIVLLLNVSDKIEGFKL
jgi:hypothetical protein